MPVDIVSGAHFTAAHDVEVWATATLIFRRTYSTDRPASTASVLGRGWLHAFDAHLVRDLEGFRFLGHDGAEIVFDGSTEELAEGEGLRNLPASMELRREGDRLAVWHWHGWQGPVQKFIFEICGRDEMRLAAIEAPSGHGLDLEYDQNSRLSRVAQSVERRCLLLEYDSSGLLGCLKLAWLGRPETLIVATYSYDKRQRLVRVLDALGYAQTYEYDDSDRLISERSPSGAVVFMKYDTLGRCVEMGGSDGTFRRTFHYEPEVRRTLVTDSLGAVTAYQYDDAGRVIETLQPNGAVTAAHFDELGRVKAVTGALAPDGVSFSNKYSDRGDLTEIQFAGGGKRRLDYDETHQVTAIHEVNGAIWRIQYHRGAVVAIENPYGALTRYIRDARNVLTGITTPWGNHIRFEHDDLWSYEKHVDKLGLIVAYEYDVYLHPFRIANSTVVQSELEYDALGRLIVRKTPEGARREYAYTPDGQLAEYVDARGGRTRFTWSPWGLCLLASDPNALAHEFEWDTEGRLKTVRNPKGERAEFDYDGVGNNIGQRFFDGRTEHYEYDVYGNVTARVRPDGTRLQMALDDAGRVLSVFANGEPQLAFAYDPAGWVTHAESDGVVVKIEYDLCGRIVSESQHGSAVRYAYGPHGTVVRREFEGGRAGPLLLDYDVRGRLSAFRSSRETLEHFQYDARDLVTVRTMSGAREKLEYNFAGRPTRQEVAGPGLGSSIIRTYSYDREGNLTVIADSTGGGRAFAYDPGERLAASESPAGRLEYEYDADGNLTRRGNVQLRYGAGDQLFCFGAVEIDRDTNGALLHTNAAGRRVCHQWDSLGQLRMVQHSDGTVTRYGYDGFGRRLFKEHNGERTDFYWSGNDLLAERTGASVTEYAVDGFWPHLIWHDGALRHAIVSPLALIHELIDGAGRLAWSGNYDPWGTLVGGAGSCPAPRLRYPGQYFDSETGFHYNRTRYYDPRSGSFISPDPIGFGGGTNLYLYAPNPVTYEDPFGLKCGARTSGQTVYVLTKGKPPVVVYVGITDQLPHDRLSDHRNNKPKGSFDNMQVIATGLTNRRDARNIEGSLLHHIYQSQSGGPAITVAGIPVAPTLLNADRATTPGYWHGYVPGSPSMGQDGRQLLTPSQINQQTDPNGPRIPRKTGR